MARAPAQARPKSRASSRATRSRALAPASDVSLSQQLEFERTVAGLSGVLLRLSLEGADRDIEDILRQLARVVGADRSALGEFDLDQGRIRLVFGFDQTVSPQQPQYVDRRELAWYWATLLKGDVVRVNRRSDLPPEATGELAWMTRHGLHANLTVPIVVGQKPYAMLSFSALAETDWPDYLVARARAIGERLATAIQQGRAHRALRQHAAVADCIARLSAMFVSVSAEHLDLQIEEALRHIVEVFGVDRAGVYQVNPESGRLMLTHSYSAPPQAPLVPFDHQQLFPWVSARLLAGEALRLRSLDDLPPEAVTDRASADRVGIKAFLGAPSGDGREGIRSLAVASSQDRDWSDGMEQQLRVLGKVLANALARQQAEEQLHRTRAELTHVTRVSALGQLASSIAHEIGQPLCAILANAQAAQRFLAAKPSNIAEVREALADIVRESSRASEIVSAAWSFSKRQPPAPVVLDLNSTVDGVIRLLASHALFRHVLVDVRLVEGRLPVRADRVQIQQVLLNLISNAIEAIPKRRGNRRGHVTVITRQDRDRSCAVVAVMDDGVGLPDGPADQVFEPFYTTKSKGLGMGLAIARQIVTQYHGWIAARRNPQGGTTFEFGLPTQVDSVL